MARKVSEISTEVVDREAIRDLLARYSRGIDRIDKALIESVYWEDATDDHVDYVGSAAGFVAFIVPLLRSMDQTSHMTGNMLIEFHGEAAHVETYFTGFHRIPAENSAASDLIVGGRYLDRMEKRRDEWRIADRKVIVDWYRQLDDAPDWANGFRGQPIVPGGRCPSDVSYTLFKAR